ncbi:hypothetical protein [Aquimarina sp. RZ0]|uniref:hypothetical protein n=1 Tax=Aquimarina sp. RZ0 TaxID=2607730 RepID=UPI0011F0F921|nr:hypothetical protein [Aquimarina sp. RZ0]KAA1247374.1 hypothetical protein F0000_03575 [Aquimarina sp. RZ0]
MKNSKNLIKSCILLVGILFFASCSKDDIQNDLSAVSQAEEGTPEIIDITQSTYHYKGKTYDGLESLSTIVNPDNLSMFYEGTNAYAFDSTEELDAHYVSEKARSARVRTWRDYNRRGHSLDFSTTGNSLFFHNGRTFKSLKVISGRAARVQVVRGCGHFCERIVFNQVLNHRIGSRNVSNAGGETLRIIAQ